MSIQISSGKLTLVGMGELKTIRNDGLIGCIGLGSCIGVLFYDPVSKTATVAHVMLPESPNPSSEPTKGKFADTAIPEMVRLYDKYGVTRRNIICGLIGGAELFRSASGPSNENLRIGVRNAERVTKLLEQYSISILLKALGGNNGRSFQFEPSTGDLNLRTSAGQQEYYQLDSIGFTAKKAA